jgi:hypothetical protein
LEKKTQQAEMAMKEKVNTQLIQGTVNTATFVPGNDTKDLLPLGYFLPKDVTAAPLAGGEVGNIARATEAWWRPKTAGLGSNGALTGGAFALDVTTYKGMLVGLRRLYNYCSRGADGSGPNISLFDQVSYETFENALDEKVRYGSTALADIGFENIRLKGSTAIWDEVVPDLQTGTAAITKGSVFMINTRFYKLAIDQETDFVVTPFIEPKADSLGLVKLCELLGTPNVESRAISSQAANAWLN